MGGYGGEMGGEMGGKMGGGRGLYLFIIYMYIICRVCVITCHGCINDRHHKVLHP